jgi:glycerol uptake facilitator-like aquaporin
MEKYLAEYLGTTFFLYVILVTGNFMAIGAALALAVYIGSHISGANYNPAVSIMMYFKGNLSATNLAPYIVAQILGGLTALKLQQLTKK